MIRRASIVLLVAVFALAGACARTPGPKPPQAPKAPPGAPKPYQIDGKWYQPLPDARGYSEKGLASWYGEDFHGKKTANGETYDMFAMTAAHKTLPLGTRVKVTNLQNGKSIFLRINDRGPFVSGRIIDLSFTSANELGVVGPGTALVNVTAVAAPEELASAGTNVYYTGSFTVQVGAFTDPENARRLKDKLSPDYKNAHVVEGLVGGKTFYRVRVGLCTDLDTARQFEKTMTSKGFPQAFTVAE